MVELRFTDEEVITIVGSAVHDLSENGSKEQKLLVRDFLRRNRLFNTLSRFEECL